jgi:hypothetical protein
MRNVSRLINLVHHEGFDAAGIQPDRNYAQYGAKTTIVCQKVNSSRGNFKRVLINPSCIGRWCLAIPAFYKAVAIQIHAIGNQLGLAVLVAQVFRHISRPFWVYVSKEFKNFTLDYSVDFQEVLHAKRF